MLQSLDKFGNSFGRQGQLLGVTSVLGPQLLGRQADQGFGPPLQPGVMFRNALNPAPPNVGVCQAHIGRIITNGHQGLADLGMSKLIRPVMDVVDFDPAISVSHGCTPASGGQGVDDDRI